MNYTLNQLRIFLEVVRHNSVTKASEELNLTQPAVSIQLKNFQDQFDIPLTEVIGRKIYITDFGQEIAEAAEKIVEEVYAINYKTQAYKGNLTGRLKITVVSTGKYIMPYFLSGFINKNKGVELKLDVTYKPNVVESLKNNEVDFSLVSIIPKSLKLKKLDLLENKLFLVGNMEKTIDTDASLHEIFENLPLIFRENSSGTRKTMVNFIKNNNLPMVMKNQLNSNEAVKQAVLAGLGYSILPLIGIHNELADKQLHIIPVKDLPIKTMWSLIWLKGKKHSPAANAFLRYLEEERANIIKRHFSWNSDY